MSAVASHREGRVIHDADSHLTEHPGWLEAYASEYVINNFDESLIPMDLPGLQPFLKAANERLDGKKPEITEELKSNLYGHPAKLNQWMAYGSINKKERSEALDIAGISSQLVFPAIALSRFARSSDPKVVYGGTEALNRGMVDFCSDDKRLLPVGYLPLQDVEQSKASLKQAIEMGVKALWLKTDSIDGKAPSHISYDPLWAMMEEAGIPIVLHIGSGIRMPDEYHNTGVERPLEPSPTNIETTRPKDLPVLHHSIERWLTCMIYDQVLERHPNLKIGLIELGSNWVPAALQNLDMGVSALGRLDINLKKLSMKPSEFFKKHVRVTPFHMEDTGWVLRNTCKEILMFNTDYPHPEGGSDPFGAFERSLNAVNATEDELDHFYQKNFEYLMGL